MQIQISETMWLRRKQTLFLLQAADSWIYGSDLHHINTRGHNCCGGTITVLHSQPASPSFCSFLPHTASVWRPCKASPLATRMFCTFFVQRAPCIPAVVRRGSERVLAQLSALHKHIFCAFLPETCCFFCVFCIRAGLQQEGAVARQQFSNASLLLPHVWMLPTFPFLIWGCWRLGERQKHLHFPCTHNYESHIPPSLSASLLSPLPPCPPTNNRKLPWMGIDEQQGEKSRPAVPPQPVDPPPPPPACPLAVVNVFFLFCAKAAE